MIFTTNFIDGTMTDSADTILMHVESKIGRLMAEDNQLGHILTHSVPLSDRPKTPTDRRAHGIARVLYTWLRIEHDNPEAVAQDIETLAALGRSEKWKSAVRAWAHIARTEPDMFHQYATYTNFRT